MRLHFPVFLSVDSAKAVKAQTYGYLNGINYMAPSRTTLANGQVVNMCAAASAGCIALCLGKYSGQAAMLADLENGSNNVRASRAAKVEFLMRDRQAFLREACVHIARLARRARALSLLPCVRMNGSTDIAWEGLALNVDAATAAVCGVVPGRYANIMSVFPSVQFVDYTKLFARSKRALPSNYHLTYSRSESNEGECLAALSAGHNVAAVFSGLFPSAWHGHPVVDGDKHDLRHLDPRGNAATGGVVIGLTPKGNKAKRDTSGFVLRIAEPMGALAA